MSSMSEAFLAAAEAEANTPIAVGVSARNGCDHTYLINEDRIDYFQSRVAELGKNPAAVVVVVINVDEPSGFGRNLAESLMPGADWQSMRDLGQVPFARGLAERAGIAEAIGKFFNPAVAEAVREYSGVPVIVVDHGIIAVY
jgi:hypothetical protein